MRLLESLSDTLQAGNLTRQMEENRRRYILQLRQQQQVASQSPVLSVQRANLIKAKLGLAVASENNLENSANRFNKQQQPTISAANSEPLVATADPPGELSAEQRHALLVGVASSGAIPKTDFECTDKRGRFVAGLFADTKTGCQVWHLCANNRKYSFLCPAGTIFNEKLRICDWRYNVRCATNSLAPTATAEQ